MKTPLFFPFFSVFLCGRERLLYLKALSLSPHNFDIIWGHASSSAKWTSRSSIVTTRKIQKRKIDPQTSSTRFTLRSSPQLFLDIRRYTRIIHIPDYRITCGFCKRKREGGSPKRGDPPVIASSMKLFVMAIDEQSAVYPFNTDPLDSQERRTDN